MAARTHNCFFKGRLVKDPELDTTAGGKITVEFRIARSKGPDRQPVYMNCKAWDSLAEHIAEKYRKGTMILVRAASYETRAMKRSGGEGTIEYPFFTIYEIGEGEEAVGNEYGGEAPPPDDSIPY